MSIHRHVRISITSPTMIERFLGVLERSVRDLSPAEAGTIGYRVVVGGIVVCLTKPMTFEAFVIGCRNSGLSFQEIGAEEHDYGSEIMEIVVEGVYVVTLNQLRAHLN